MQSSGGNDVELVNILNQCIFQWASVNKGQVLLGKTAALTANFEWAKDFDWDALGRGCSEQLDHTAALIADDAFSKNIDAVIEAAKAKLDKK